MVGGESPSNLPFHLTQNGFVISLQTDIIQKPPGDDHQTPAGSFHPMGKLTGNRPIDHAGTQNGMVFNHELNASPPFKLPRGLVTAEPGKNLEGDRFQGTFSGRRALEIVSPNQGSRPYLTQLVRSHQAATDCYSKPVNISPGNT